MQMPLLDPDILRRRAEIVAALRAIVPGEGVIDDLDAMRPYECDALSAYRQMPLVVVLPDTVPQVSAILRYCQDHKVKVVPRGAGTSLSGGSIGIAVDDGREKRRRQECGVRLRRRARHCGARIVDEAFDQ
ncbi:MAG TPA: FAD-binding protein, partial [Reyranella sp.]|nr:FAD-binding protein [Reyranella sp.]